MRLPDLTQAEYELLRWAVSYATGAAQEHQDDDTGRALWRLTEKLMATEPGGEDETAGPSSPSAANQKA